jgi:hypothetical protein
MYLVTLLSQSLAQFRSHHTTTAESWVANNTDSHIKKCKTLYLLNARKIFLFQKCTFFE